MTPAPWDVENAAKNPRAQKSWPYGDAGLIDRLTAFATAAIVLDTALRRRGAVVAKKKALTDATESVLDYIAAHTR